MRKLTISTKECKFKLKDTPNKYLWIERIGCKYANSLDELAALYSLGLAAYKKAESEMDSKTLERFGAYLLKQAVIRGLT